MSEKERKYQLSKHAKVHIGQQLRRAPLVPFHHVVFDPMHGVHNEANVLLDESIHRHLMVQSCEPEVKAVINQAQEEVNALWKTASLPGNFIQFGRDSQGAHSHALNGPAFKAVWRRPELIIQSIKIMEPVYSLLESKRLTPELQPDAIGEGADFGPEKRGETRKAGATQKRRGAQKARGVAWDEEEVRPGAEDECHPRPLAATGTDDIRTPPVELSYAQRVGAAFVAFIQFYEHLHSDHGIPASQLDRQTRSARGDTAVQLALEMQRAMLALIGTHRRRTYAHDLVYGTYQLYMLFGKPWNAATEGNEHAHQDMKNFFHRLVSHNPKAPHSDCYAVLRLFVIKNQMLQNTKVLSNSKYAAMRANRVLAENAVTKPGKKRGRESGPKGLRCYDAHDLDMQESAKRIQNDVVDKCAECAAHN